MASKRRKWQENLRNNCEMEATPKKAKVKILKEKVYKEENGRLVLQKVRNYSNLSKDIDEGQLSDSSTSIQKKNVTTPKTSLSKIETLTPTFRNPENYLAAAAEVMKEISPKSHPINRSSEDNIHIDKNLHDFVCSDITLNNTLEIEASLSESVNVMCSEEVSKKTNLSDKKQIAAITAQNISPIQCISIDENCLKKANETGLNYSDWENYESYEVEVTIERNLETGNGSTHKKKLDINGNLSTEPSIEEVSEEIDNIVTGSVFMAKKIMNSIRVQSPIFSDTIDGIEPAPNSELANIEDIPEGRENIDISSKFMTENINEIGEQSAIFADTGDDIRPSPDSDFAKSAYENCNKNFVRRSKRKLNFNISYLDFVDDDADNILLNEAFPSEESSIGLSDATTFSSDSDENNSKKDKKQEKLKKKFKKQKSEKKVIEEVHQLPLVKRKSKSDIKKENTEKKKRGESYINTKGEIVEGKFMKTNPCVGVKCGNNCGNISEERRISIFKHFWGLADFQRRKDWIAQCAIKKSIKRPSKDAQSNRSHSYEYFINEGEGRRKVCQKFLLATLDVTQRLILYTLDTMIDGFSKSDGRGSAGGHNKTSDHIIKDAKDFIHHLPLLPSHYCRRDSTKLYLPEEFKNISNLYRIYQKHCLGKKIMSFKVFSGWFRKTFNIGFHIPKKDKCALCASSKSFDVKTQEDMEKLKQHENEKEESYKRFIFHQNLNKKDKGTVCASFDLQKVLNTPYGESMTLYYSRKIAVYNFTIYESNTKLGICNLWTEADAKRGANEIATCLLEYIKSVDTRGNVKQIILYCDSAFGQNKNKTILAMLRYSLSISENIETIQINYLIPGHTYMPVDSIHATIENSVKNAIVWAPSQWPTIIQFSRKNPMPYTVNVLNGQDFLGFENIVEQTFKKNQNIQISKISIVTFRKKQLEKMFVKNSMLPSAEAIEVQLCALNDANLKLKLYPSKLPICQKKYADLKKLVEKQVIPKRFANEYLGLKTNSKVKDCLPDTDVEDNN